MGKFAALLSLFITFAQPVAAWAQPSVARELVKQADGSLIYIVNDRAPSLSFVARELYGDRRMAVEIARWNKLPSEAWVKPGDRLLIKVEPKLSDAEGTTLLIRYWRMAGNDERAARLEALSGSEPQTIASYPTPLAWPLKGYPPIMGGWLPGYPLPDQKETRRSERVPERQAANQSIARPKQSTATPYSRQSAPSASGPSQMKSNSHSGSSASSASGEAIESGGQATFVKRKQASVTEVDAPGAEPKNENYWLGKDATELIERIGRKLGLSEPENPGNPGNQKIENRK